MKPSYLRQGVQSQPLLNPRSLCSVACRTYPKSSRHPISQSVTTLARRQSLRIRDKTAFPSQSIIAAEISSAQRPLSKTATSRIDQIRNISHQNSPRSWSITSLAKPAWRAEMYSRDGRVAGNWMRHKSGTSTTRNDIEQKAGRNGSPSSPTPSQSNKEPPTHPETPSSAGKYLNLGHLPKMPHRPTKEELLAAATGFWSRLKVRFKWFSIRSVRPWNVDDWSAFVSWFVLGNIVWILVGTTTFFSLVILSINTVVAQGTLSNTKYLEE